MSEVKKITINYDLAGQRLDNFLINLLKGVPKSKIYSIIRKGEIRINSRRKKPLYKLCEGDEIRIPPIKVSSKKNNFVASNIVSLVKDSIVYEDENFIAIDKPEGIASHGGSGINIGIIEAVRNIGKQYRSAKLVHRLDKNTSGCQIIAKNNKFLRHCNKLIASREVEKTYLAVVYGRWNLKDGLYEINLEKNLIKGNERVVKKTEGGKKAKTGLYNLEVSKHFSLLKCNLHTGRTHQLRVQLSSLGFPIVGDQKYRIKKKEYLNTNFDVRRMYLHSQSFVIKELDINLKVKPPEDFKKILKNDE